MGKPRASMSLLCVAFALSCAPEVQPATQVIVVVGGDPQIDVLKVTVRSSNGLQFVGDYTIDLPARTSDGQRLPTSFTVEKAGANGANDFRLLVTGARKQGRDTIPIVRRIVKASFTAGQATLLPVALATSCLEELCGCSWDDDSCNQTCEPAGAGGGPPCVEVPTYERLPEVEPGDELNALAAGAGECDRGEVVGPQQVCEDLNECTFGADDCDHAPFACENIVNGIDGWQCHCPPGYVGTGEGPEGCQPRQP